MKDNIILIGMPGCGKSTIGVLLAKNLAYGFLDSDLVIQEQSGRKLQDMIDEMGPEAFSAFDDRRLCGLRDPRHGALQGDRHRRVLESFL